MKKNKHTPSDQELKKLADEVLEDAKKIKRWFLIKRHLKNSHLVMRYMRGKRIII